MKIPGIPKIILVAKEKRLKGTLIPLKIEKLLNKDTKASEKKIFLRLSSSAFFSPNIFRKK